MYFGEFNSIQDIADAFQDPSIVSHLDESTIHLAMYDNEGYEGRAWVIYEHQGQLYEVNASHCSCYGLEGQWDPIESDWRAIAKYDYYWFPEEVNAYMRELCKRN